MPSSSYMADRSPSNAASTSGSPAYIEHTVTRLDTLVGVAIKYGVEVADVKRYNGLTTDLQMFALKTLRIPTPGRHPPSAAIANPVQSRCESSTRPSCLHHESSYKPSLPSSIKLKAMEKLRDTSAMDLLRGYYGLPSMSRTEGEGTEMATFSSDHEACLEKEPLMFRPPNTSDSRRFPAGDDMSTRSVRDSCNNILDSCWSVQSSSSESSHLMKPSKKLVRVGEKYGKLEVVSDADSQIKERPFRRRGRGEFGSDETFDVNERVNFPKRDPPPRPKDSDFGIPHTRLLTSVPTREWQNAREGTLGSSGMKNFAAALLGGKGAVEGLISNVLQSANATTPQDGGKFSSERLPPSTGNSGVLEGITSVYRQAKAALD